MKIDLHLHTQKIKKSESEDRDITPERFKNELINANVGIAAITNHHFFDENQYKKMIDNENYILLPGVELDVSIKEKDYEKTIHANVIAHPKNIKILKEILDRIKNNQNPIKYEDFCNEFNKEKWIIYLDYKNSNDRSWSSKYIKNTIKKMDKTFVLVDTNKATTLMVLNSHSFNALIGSDITDWNNYQEKSKDLINTRFEIESYDKFWSILNFKEKNINKLFENIEKRKFENIEMEDSTPDGIKNYLINFLLIKSGVNIIFGAKRTGKTEILKHINNKTKNNNSYYESSYRNEAIKELKTKLFNEDTFINQKNEWKKIINEILNYKEEKFCKFSDFYQFLFLKGKTRINFHNKISTANIDPLLNKEKNNKKKMIFDLKNSIKLANENINKLKIKNDIWKNVIIKILNDAWELYVNIFKNFWKNKINIEIKNNIDKLMSKNKGIKSKPGDIGLLKRFGLKQKFKNNLENLENFKKEDISKLKQFEIPKRDEVWASQYISFIDFYNLKNIKKFNKKLKIKNISNQLKKFKKQKFMFDFNKIKSSFIEFNEDEKKYYSEVVLIKDKNNNSTFSNGENAHLLLQNVLSNEKADFFILDEPSMFLSRESITKFLLPKISELSSENKKIIIATHNSSIGINTIPINYIYRKYKNNNDECETYVGSIWEKKFTNIKNSNDKIDFQDVIIGSFEGSKKHFKFRKDIYESEI